jgi:hypothetical protein
MRSAHWIMAALLASLPATGAWAVEGDGLTPSGHLWPRWQGRLSLGTITPLLRQDHLNADARGLKVTGRRLLGDYAFSRSLHRLGDGGGLRATSGVLVGSRSATLLSTAAGTGLTGRAFSADRRQLGSFGWTNNADMAGDPGAVPYVGVGYTGLSSSGSWGFSADLGVMALDPNSAVKLGRVFSGNQSLDDVLREMRLSPLVQLGVSYSF